MARKRPLRWENTSEYKKMKDGLTDNLYSRGLVEPMYSDKIEEYMTLWVQFQKLKADVEDRGVTVRDEKRGMEVENRSVSLGIQVSRQMLNIYSALGFKEISTSGERGEQIDNEL